ncbi:S-layer homology domain-containing protein [Alkalinema sp. FACHB-956]|uniref:S-layer homology domain-containing protein n=1 Tax=Alkalinema sp. FACHB-956 TaxID=2692768 RepID=UPI001683BD76|nr:S-layer homology domain-containing protein [Alkalinema sp. FACHB-956]MBD2326707.1 S-layer homology domain-containing protein [Alkalinema sp. FACHB-956]
MTKASRLSSFTTFVKTLLLGGILGATGIVVLLFLKPQWFQNVGLVSAPQATASPTVEPTASPSATLPATPIELTARPTPQASPVDFEDTAGVFGAKEIAQLSALGVFEKTTGKFNPQQPITRAEFLRWLVRANNAIWETQPDKTVREATGGKATFSDVPASHPDFRYIQGVVNAGIAVGYDATTFKPDEPLTREQMIAIKIGLDYGGIPELKEKKPGTNVLYADSNIPPWSDRDRISPKFKPAFRLAYTDPRYQALENKNYFKNVERSFGAIKTLNPQAPVTRLEAALCLSLFGTHSISEEFRTAEQALQDRQKAAKAGP